MEYDRALMKYGIKQKLRQARPRPMLVALVYLLASNLFSFVVESIRTMVAGDSEAILMGIFQNLSYEIQNNVVTEQELIAAFTQASGYIGQVVSAGLLFGIIAAIVNWTMSFGFDGYCLDLARDKQTGFGRLACALPQWGWVLLTGLLVALFVGLWAILISLGAGALTVLITVVIRHEVAAILAIVVWLAAMVCIVAVALRYVMANFILLDERVDALEAISRSKAMMRGRKWQFFVLMLSFIGWYLLVGLISAVVSGIGAAIMGPGAVDGSISPFLFVGGSSLVFVLSLLITLPLNIWLQPYVGASRAAFYDLMRQTDHAHGVWEGAPVTPDAPYQTPDAPVIPRYEEPAAPAEPVVPQQPAQPETPPQEDAPDRPDYE